MDTLDDEALNDRLRDMPELEIALLRRGLDQRLAGGECCSQCRRNPLIGERIYLYGPAAIVCELCRAQRPDPPHHSRLVHGPAFGHTIRTIGQRAA